MGWFRNAADKRKDDADHAMGKAYGERVRQEKSGEQVNLREEDVKHFTGRQGYPIPATGIMRDDDRLKGWIP